MSIYDQNMGSRIPDFLNNKIVFFGIIVVAIIIAIAYFAMPFLASALEPNAMKINFDRNPLDLKASAETILYVHLTNYTDTSAENIVVNVNPKDSNSLHIFPGQRTIPVLGESGNRTLNFRVQPNPQTGVIEGSYGIDVSTALNGKEYSETVFLKIVN